MISPFTKIIRNSFLIAAPILLVANTQAGVDRVGNFSLIDQHGSQHQLAKYGHKKAVVVISQANSCTVNINKLPKYKLLRTTWESQGVEFLMLNASIKDNLDSIRQASKVYGIEMPIMVDDSQLVAETLNITKAGEIVVLNPSTMQVLYRGDLDKPIPRNREGEKPQPVPPQHIADTLARAVAGEKTESTISVAVENGCELSFPMREMHAKNVPDYAKDVAPILKDSCANCHVEGGIGPFAMNSYDMIRGWAPMMKEVLLTKRMPPAQVDPSINHFTNARYMSSEELQTLVHWFDAGAPRGNSKIDPLNAVVPIEADWQLGEPDYVVDVPGYDVPATGVLDYVNVTLDLPFKEDKYVRAVQFIPGDSRVLHHLLTYVASPDYERGQPIDEENVRDFLEGYAPGKSDATYFPKNTGVFIPKGHKLTMSVHYTTMGKAVRDETRLGLYFYDKPPAFEYLTESISHGGTNLVIPPGAMEHKMNWSYVFDDEIMLYAMRPHMHFRGKHMRFKAILPDNSVIDLLNVPDYNFAWQPTYRLEKPIRLPAGTRVVIDGAFDNSEYNPGNPDPDAVVIGGRQSWDEMFIGYFTYYKTGADSQDLTSN